MAQIDIGKLSIGPHKGDYNNSTAYVANDIVYYNGSAYIAKQSTTGNLPTDTNNWNTFSAGSGGIWNSGLSIGSEGQVVKVSSGALAFGTVSSDFVKVASGTISSGVSSYNIDGHFSSTYKHYELIFDDVYGSTTGQDLYMRVLQGGSVKTSANYGYSYRYQGVNSSGQNNVGDTGGWTSTSANVTNNISSAVSTSAMLHFRIYDPLATDKHKHITFHNLVNYNNNAGVLNQLGGFQFRSTNALSGVQIFPQSGTLNGGNWSLYGIKP